MADQVGIKLFAGLSPDLIGKGIKEYSLFRELDNDLFFAALLQWRRSRQRRTPLPEPCAQNLRDSVISFHWRRVLDTLRGDALHIGHRIRARRLSFRPGSNAAPLSLLLELLIEVISTVRFTQTSGGTGDSSEVQICTIAAVRVMNSSVAF